MKEESYSQFLLKLLAPGGNDGDVSRNNFFKIILPDDETNVAKLSGFEQTTEIVP